MLSWIDPSNQPAVSGRLMQCGAGWRVRNDNPINKLPFNFSATLSRKAPLELVLSAQATESYLFLLFASLKFC